MIASESHAAPPDCGRDLTGRLVRTYPRGEIVLVLGTEHREFYGGRATVHRVLHRDGATRWIFAEAVTDVVSLA